MLRPFLLSRKYQKFFSPDVSTLSFVQMLDVSGQTGAGLDVALSSDGSVMFVLGGGGVNEYTLSAAWDVSSASYVDVFNLTETSPISIAVGGDGAYLYVADSATDTIRRYDMTTPWDVSTASASQAIDITSDVSGPLLSVATDKTGSNLYVTDGDNNVRQYEMSTEWDLSTASLVGSVDVSAYNTNPRGVFVTGNRVYVLDAVSEYVQEFSLSTPWDILSAAFVQEESVAASINAPLGMFVSTDGTKVYLASAGDDVIAEYDATTYF